MPSKIRGAPAATFHGLKIYLKFLKAKSRGMDRIWVGIRQDEPKIWRTATTLSYVNGVDILFRGEGWKYQTYQLETQRLKRKRSN